MITDAQTASIYKLSAASETLLFPLYCRALETRSKDPIIRDPKAVEIAEELNREFGSSERRLLRDLARGDLSPKLVATMALRTRRFDRYVADFLAAHPDGAVLNLGCGLDTRFSRLDNGRARWYELDLPEVIELRRRFFTEGDRCRFIASSVLDFRWMDGLRRERGRPVLVTAEGLFMYLREEQVRSLVLELAGVFPGAELVCEVAGMSVIRLMRTRLGRGKFKRRFHLSDDVVFSFGIEKGTDLEKWGTGIRFLDEWTFFDDDERKLGWFRIFRHFKSFKYAQWTVHYRLGPAPGS